MLLIAAAAMFTAGSRARSTSPRRNWLLIWTGVDGDRYFIDTSTVTAPDRARGQGTLTAFYVQPLILHGRLGISTQIREDALTFDCARETLTGGATWRRYGVAMLRGRISAPDSIFADSRVRNGPRYAALEYACRTLGRGHAASTGDVAR